MKLDRVAVNQAFNYKYLLKRIFPYIKPLLPRIIIAAVITIPLGLLDGVTTFVLKPYIDVVVNGNEMVVKGFTLTRDLLALVIPPAIVIFAALQGVLRYINTYLTDWISITISNSVKIDLFKKLVYMDSKFYDENSSGLIYSRFAGDPDIASRQLIGGIKNIVTSFASALGLVCVLIYNSWQLALVGVIVLVFAFAPMVFLRKKIKEVSNKSMVVGGGIITSYVETYAGNKLIAGYNIQEDEFSKIKNLIRQVFTLQMSLTKRMGWLSPIMYIVASIGVAVVMYVGNELIKSGNLTTGSFASFIASLLLLYRPIKSLGQDLAGIQMVFVALNRVFELFDLNSRIEDKGTIKLDKSPEDIEFKNISFSYDEGVEVLHDISFTARHGQTIAFVGNSGGGKSTIVSLIPRFYDVDKGQILFNGKDIREYTLRSLRDSVSEVFQNNFLFTGTIRDNILIGKKNATKEELDKVIKASHLDEFIETLERGIDTQIGENGSSLSGGQKQRIAIARAMIKDSPIVVLDEATSALDNKSEKIVQKALDNLMKNRTVFVIAHRLSTIFNADKIIFIENGCIAEQGTHEELLKIENGKYKTLYDMQFKNQEE